jgi:hypothetical protein
MNWYKQIKIAEPVFEKDTFEETGNPNYPGYADIGHETFITGKPFIKGCKEFIWAFVDGNIEVLPATKMETLNSSHGRIWGCKETLLTYRGRVTKCKDKASISLVPPIGPAMFRDIPNIVISRLYEKFGPNSKIYIIRPGNNQ